MKKAFTLEDGAAHVDKITNNSKKAFMLAEVLITLGIIGVVAAMTLPAMIQKQQKKEVIVSLQKMYSTLMQAAESYQAANGIYITEFDLKKNKNPFLNS